MYMSGGARQSVVEQENIIYKNMTNLLIPFF